LAIAVAVWSLASGIHGFMTTVLGFCIARVLLGLSEGGNFPAAIKTIGQWFPKSERALATGIFNSGSNVGIVVAALAVPWITHQLGWPATFISTAGLGVFWLALWLPLFRPVKDHRWLSDDERRHILSDSPENSPDDSSANISWAELLRYRQTWAFALAMMLVTPVWVFYTNWLPGFFQQQHTLNLTELGLPLVAIYLITDFGSIGGGWLSSHFIVRGWSVAAARKLAMFCCSLCVLPVFFATDIASLWPAVLVLGLAAAAHQGFMANLYTVVTDTMPGRVASSVVGIGGMAGSFAAMLGATLIGRSLDLTQSYYLPFCWASASYLVALCVLQMLLPSERRERSA
jgi:ACS family hexuronate transporter-like MFS transporter